MKQWSSVVRRFGGTRRAAVRLCLAVDIKNYSRFTNVEAARAQHRFVEVLRGARAYAGLKESEVDIQRSGDGQFVVLPSGLDESVVIPDLVAGLSVALRRTNADLSTHARLRLRVALYRGLLRPDVNGWVGSAAIAVHRLLDSEPLRTALEREPAADFALAVGDSVYRDVIVHGYRDLPAGRFRPVDVDIPAKNFAERAWIYVGGGRVTAG